MQLTFHEFDSIILKVKAFKKGNLNNAKKDSKRKHLHSALRERLQGRRNRRGNIRKGDRIGISVFNKLNSAKLKQIIYIGMIISGCTMLF